MDSSSISVAVRVRPFSEKERPLLCSNHNQGPTLFASDPTSTSALLTPQPPRTIGSGAIRKVLKVLDERILVFDPPETNAVASFQRAILGPPVMGKKVKDIRFCFDRVFDEGCGQEEVYDGSAKELVGHVMNGFHSSVFAYGATGCGKTHTISGSQTQPGIVFLLMRDLFERIKAKSNDTDFSLTVSYLEIYNETIRDLLAPESGPLQLRESNGTAAAAGLSTKEPSNANDVVEWITYGNQNRTVNATEANATSSRSHAVLSVTVTQKPKAGGLVDNTQSASLSVIDLAGSERASVTKNKGERLLEGANINRSLLALGNCINALCDPRKRGHVPYRDSKLTRLLKPSLGGNCKTVMIVCVSPSSAHYDETHNTLQYANRAKEIKTKAVRNVISVDRHVAEYCRQIMEQSEQIALLKKQLAERDAVASTEAREADAKAVHLARHKLTTSWEQGKGRVVTAERSKVEKAGIGSILNVLDQWRAAAFEAIDASPSEALAGSSTLGLVRTGCDSLIFSLSSTSNILANDISMASSSLDMYNILVDSLKTSMRAKHPHVLSQLELEIKVLELRLENELAQARSVGMSENMKVQARAMHSMCEARIKVGAALDAARSEEGPGGEAERALRKFADSIDLANRTAFIALTSDLSTGTKRDAGARSPLELQSPWKSARATVSGVGSAPSGSFASPARTSFMKQSPRKAVSFKARSGGMKSVSPKKRKEVQWRDEVGDGEGDLEDVKWQSPAETSGSISVNGTPQSVASPLISISASSASHPAQPVAPISSSGLKPFSSSRSTTNTTSILSSAPKTAPPLFSLTAPLEPWASGSTASTTSAADKMVASIKQRSTTGTLKNRASFTRLGLPSVSESKPFSFMRDAASPSTSAASRTPFADLANTSVSSTGSASESYSMAGPSGLYAPLVKKPVEPDTPRRAAARARRTSQIGPQRSLKPIRRTSYAVPPSPATHIGPTRKMNRGGSSSFFAPPSAIKKLASPRKATGLSTSSTGRSSFPGGNSAARAAMRRESAAAGNTSIGSVGSVGRGSPALTGGSGNGTAAKSIWR
ncbi:kinesin-domain-containing protein [Meredithblackwellia eburnea MCA 4105]